jgi:GNAT superfamily N-acetyltransferase
MRVSPSPTAAPGSEPITIGPLRAEDLAAADRVVRLAFGTFLGLPESEMFREDADSVRTRWKANPSSAFAAWSAEELVGSVFAANWGSVGFFGPLTVRPDHWDRGVGQRLLAPVMALFDRWGTKQAGLYTFAQSQKHMALYQKFGFWPRFLSMIMGKPIEESTVWPSQASVFSEVAPGDRAACLEDCRGVCDAIYEGLDVRIEIESVATQSLGDTVLLRDGDRLEGLAVCHVGPGTEAGSGTCYVKFGAVRPGPFAGAALERLLESCAALGAARGATRLLAGVNTARHEAYGILLARGFRTQFQGVAMHRPNEPGYNRPGAYILDDWR